MIMSFYFLGSIEVNQSDCPPACFTKQAKNVKNRDSWESHLDSRIIHFSFAPCIDSYSIRYPWSATALFLHIPNVGKGATSKTT